MTGRCDNKCSGHGSCLEQTNRCQCYKGLNGEDEWTGTDCSLRACPKGIAWAHEVLVSNNDVHPWIECSNRGSCNRDTGECDCEPGIS